MGNLGISTFLNSLVQGMEQGKQRDQEMTQKKELLKLEQDKLKIQERESMLKGQPNPFEELTKQIELEQKAAQMKKSQFDLAQSEKKAQEDEYLKELRLKAGEELAGTEKYIREQRMTKLPGAMKDKLYQLHTILGKSPDQIQTTMEIQGFEPKYKPESTKPEKDELPKYLQKRWSEFESGMIGMGATRNLNPVDLALLKESKFKEFKSDYEKMQEVAGGRTPIPSVGKGIGKKEEKPRFVIKGVK